MQQADKSVHVINTSCYQLHVWCLYYPMYQFHNFHEHTNSMMNFPVKQHTSSLFNICSNNPPLYDSTNPILVHYNDILINTWVDDKNPYQCIVKQFVITITVKYGECFDNVYASRY